MGDKTVLPRFWGKVDASAGLECCWLWTAGLFTNGYGQFTRRHHQPVGAHVYSWELHNGPVPAGLFVLHNCPGGDDRRCVNPLHLWVGTHDENMADMVAKGMAAAGSRHGSALHPERWSHRRRRIPPETIVLILEASGPVRDVAVRFGISKSFVHNLRQGKQVPEGIYG